MVVFDNGGGIQLTAIKYSKKKKKMERGSHREDGKGSTFWVVDVR
jgi:hypothetical protein